MDTKLLTIFTPTYNRSYILGSLYKRLKDQTIKDFKWLIVDDGSTDNTQNIVKNWISQETSFEIIYIKQKNGGKQRAHNKAVEMCDTELFFCVDSDDHLVETAVEKIKERWIMIKKDKSIAGIVALRGIDSKTPIGTKMPSNISYTTLYDLYNKYKFKGDTALIYRTDILKKYPFYVYEDEKFIGEAYVYYQIDQNYKLNIFNKVLYLCKYLDDGYTKNIKKIIVNNPKGYSLLNKMKVKYANNMKEKLISNIKYLIGYFISKEKGCFRNSESKLITIFTFPMAYILYKIKYNENDPNEKK
jgi:glycosyltransferase involved in cell wall biosynthesis